MQQLSLSRLQSSRKGIAPSEQISLTLSAILPYMMAMPQLTDSGIDLSMNPKGEVKGQCGKYFFTVNINTAIDKANESPEAFEEYLKNSVVSMYKA